MALVSENAAAAGLDMAKNRRLSFREPLNDDDFDGFSSDEEGDEEDEVDDDTAKDPDTAEIASMERKSLKYRKSLTMLNQFAGLQMTPTGGDGGALTNLTKGQPSKEHLLAAKKSIDDLTAWVNAGALGEDDDPFGGDDD
ncbi:hypothetical protein EMPS_00454 [Entomortierella parvispora]|uniref:Uncharacterized protein n=1 Tax=Entomortierella parvispora TaxID=205924 RepID=A0A9P3LRN0_9FUNG|nr:hypothetical protein EMPS_00454 [Entomortierella parvispora]